MHAGPARRETQGRVMAVLRSPFTENSDAPPSSCCTTGCILARALPFSGSVSGLFSGSSDMNRRRDVWCLLVGRGGFAHPVCKYVRDCVFVFVSSPFCCFVCCIALTKRWPPCMLACFTSACCYMYLTMRLPPLVSIAATPSAAAHAPPCLTSTHAQPLRGPQLLQQANCGPAVEVTLEGARVNFSAG